MAMSLHLLATGLSEDECPLFRQQNTLLYSREGPSERVQDGVTWIIELGHDVLYHLYTLLLRTEHGESVKTGSIGMNGFGHHIV